MSNEWEASALNVGGSQGVQAGTGNTQVNTWVAHLRPDLASLSGLSAHAAVARIRRMKRNDVVDLFAGAAPADIAEVFGSLLAADEALAVAVLAEIRPSRAQELATLRARSSRTAPTGRSW
jgi:hypothetical protein